MIAPSSVVDVTPGVLATALPPLAGETFLRLAAPIGEPADGARAAYMRIVNAQLADAGGQLGGCRTGWLDGPGLLVGDPTPVRALTALVHELGAALRLLADPDVAERYLTLVGPRVRAIGPDAQP